MASGKRASMREGPLAQLFRKTEEDDARSERKPRQEERPPAERTAEQEQVTRHVSEPRAQTEQHDLGGRRTEAARRARDREERRTNRYQGVPTPEERLRAVFSQDIPENIL